MRSRDHPGHSAAAAPRPLFTHPRLILYVFLGGMLGTAGREGVALILLPSDGGIPWAVLAVNLVGAFLLGFLLTALAARTPESPARRDVRLFAGTGLLGGFTTYSSLATDTAILFETNAALAVAYGIGSVVLGILAAWLGIALAARVFPAQPKPVAS